MHLAVLGSIFSRCFAGLIDAGFFLRSQAPSTPSRYNLCDLVSLAGLWVLSLRILSVVLPRNLLLLLYLWCCRVVLISRVVEFLNFLFVICFIIVNCYFCEPHRSPRRFLSTAPSRLSFLSQCFLSQCCWNFGKVWRRPCRLASLCFLSFIPSVPVSFTFWILLQSFNSLTQSEMPAHHNSAECSDESLIQVSLSFWISPGVLLNSGASSSSTCDLVFSCLPSRFFFLVP